MDNKTTLTENDRSLLSSALRLAIEKYIANVSDLRIMKTEQTDRLADIFEQQAKDATRIVELIEDSDRVEVIQ